MAAITLGIIDTLALRVLYARILGSWKAPCLCPCPLRQLVLDLWFQASVVGTSVVGASVVGTSVVGASVGALGRS